MTSKQPMITGELRKWRLLAKPNITAGIKGVIEGLMFNDKNGIWHDGDIAVININDWKEGSTFFLAHTHISVLKCMKDEELGNGSQR